MWGLWIDASMYSDTGWVGWVGVLDFTVRFQTPLSTIFFLFSDFLEGRGGVEGG